MYRFCQERQIGWGDLDSAGIVYYPRYYEWIDATSHMMFDDLGLNMKLLWQSRQLQFGLAETRCHYLKPGRYLDKIRIVSEIEDLGKKTVTLKTRIIRIEDDMVLAEAMEKRICIDSSNPEQMRAKDIPEDILAILRRKMTD